MLLSQIKNLNSIHTLLLPTVHKFQFHSACKHTDVRSKCIKAVQQIQRPCHPYKIYSMKNVPQALGITIRSLILNISTNTLIRLITPLTNNMSPIIFQFTIELHAWVQLSSSDFNRSMKNRCLELHFKDPFVNNSYYST